MEWWGKGKKTLSKNKSKDHKGDNPAEIKKGEDAKALSAEEQGKAQEAESAPKQEPNPLEKLQAQLEEKTREAAESYDKYLRQLAEFDNYKKRMQKEKADSLRFGNESLLKGFLPVLDNLERAIDHGKKPGQGGTILEGVEITIKQFLNTLQKFGVKPIAALGEVFDPEKHEAVAQAESDQEADRVIAEAERGYSYHERLLRPAKVVVSRGKAEEKTED
jgi:molecular chaperone GrpE